MVLNLFAIKRIIGFKKIITVIVLSFFITNIIVAQTAATYIFQAKEKQKKHDELGALEQYSLAIIKEPTNVVALLGASFNCAKLGEISTNVTSKNNYLTKAKNFASMALRLAPNNAEANYLYAISLGITNNGTPKEKLENSKTIKKHLDKALALDKNHVGAWHGIGMYNYNISQLNAVKKAAVEAFYGGVPPGDLPTAIKCMEKSYSLDKAYIRNMMDLATAYKTNNQKTKAIEMCKLIATTAIRYSDDKTTKVKAAKLLKEML